MFLYLPLSYNSRDSFETVVLYHKKTAMHGLCICNVIYLYICKESEMIFINSMHDVEMKTTISIFHSSSRLPVVHLALTNCSCSSWCDMISVIMYSGSWGCDLSVNCLIMNIHLFITSLCIYNSIYL